MTEAIVFLTDGFEEIEALSVLDILRRGEVEVLSVSLTGHVEVTGAHNIMVKADITYDEMAADTLDTSVMLILPGGAGTEHYKRHGWLLELLAKHHQEGGRISAICAAPTVLGMLGILEGKKAVCYPSFEAELTGAKIGRKAVETDGNIITSKGPATAMLFSLTLLRAIKGKKAAKRVSKKLLEPTLKKTYE